MNDGKTASGKGVMQDDLVENIIVGAAFWWALFFMRKKGAYK